MGIHIKHTLYALLSLPLLCHAAPSLKSYKATYQVQAYHVKVGTLTRQLTLNPSHYTLSVKADSQLPLLSLDGSESSTGTWEHNYPIPSTYRYTYSYRDTDKERTLAFDWDHNTVTVDNQQLTIPVPTYDKLSYQLALRHDLKMGNTTLRYDVVDKAKLKTYAFTIQKPESLHTALGDLDTILVERQHKSRTIQLWFAPKLDYVIVQAKYYHHDKLEACAEIEQITFA